MSFIVVRVWLLVIKKAVPTSMNSTSMLSTTRSNTPRGALRFDFGFRISDLGLEERRIVGNNNPQSAIHNPQLLRSLFLIAASPASMRPLCRSLFRPSSLVSVLFCSIAASRSLRRHAIERRIAGAAARRNTPRRTTSLEPHCLLVHCHGARANGDA